MKIGAGILAIIGMLICAPVAHAEVIGIADKEIQAVVNPLLDTVFAGLAETDYDTYVTHFDATMKESISPERFQQISRQIKEMFGLYLYREYLGFINKADFTTVLWRGVFDKADNDVLIRLVVSRRDDSVVITGLWFE